jgi:hypothetical protein
VLIGIYIYIFIYVCVLYVVVSLLFCVFRLLFANANSCFSLDSSYDLMLMLWLYVGV